MFPRKAGQEPSRSTDDGELLLHHTPNAASPDYDAQIQDMFAQIDHNLDLAEQRTGRVLAASA